MTSDTTTRFVDASVLDKLANPGAGGLAALDAWWRANNYLTVGQIYLKANPLLDKRGLTADDIKPRLLGHWGTSPGLSFVYAHASRLIRLTGQQMIYLAGPGHGGPALVAASYLEGSYTETFPRVTQDVPGLVRLFRQFSAPGGIPSHASVTTPGSIHEGGELGYALIHAFGAVMDNPDLIALTVVGDGEAETGPLEGSWKGISYLNPAHDGAVLPILHLNGAKIAGPALLARKRPEEVRQLFEGHGYEVLEVEGGDLPGMHHRFAAALATAYEKIKTIQAAWRGAQRPVDVEYPRPRWPMIILRSPKGWTGPHEVDGIVVEGTWRAHQVPLAGVRENPEHLAILEQWLRSYRPEELFDEDGYPADVVRANNPTGPLRMSANPHANGGRLTRPLDMPDVADYEVEVPEPAKTRHESTRVLGELARELYIRNPIVVPGVLPRRDQLQPSRRGVRRERAGVHGAGDPRRRQDRAGRPGHGGALRAQLPRLARGIHPHRAARAVRDVRGVLHGQRLADHPARQVARGGQPPVLAGQGAQPQHPADVDRLA